MVVAANKWDLEEDKPQKLTALREAFERLLPQLRGAPLVTVSAKTGLPDPAANPRLRAACAAARQANMPRDTIERAIKKAAGGAGGDDYVEVRYEGYGPSGIAIIVEALTDNRNRTASDVRAAFSKHGGALGETKPALARQWAAFWQRWASWAFVKGYLEQGAGCPFVPAADDELRILLDTFTLEKAIYELGYELNHRPQWVEIALRGVADSLGARLPDEEL